jgi:Uncharacterized protein conserved in bacteria
MLALLDRIAALQMNAVILQVRPSMDAFYASTLEPWSEYLTGQQGRAPEPFWDPLASWIREAHRRGLELHAWINPYRARAAAARGPEAATHAAQRLPQAIRRYGELLWADPAEPAAQAHTLAVVRELLSRYDLDGLHIDDYFYPYPIRDAQGQKLDFPDEPAWQAYLSRGGRSSRADWRRAQVDRLVESIHDAVRRLRPEARFGISPFGLPRPEFRPPGIAGFSQYDELYADVERWLAEGWLDYLVPQLYWPIAQTAQSFEPLLKSWLSLNPKHRHIFPGLYTSRLPAPNPQTAATGWPRQEIEAQIVLARRILAEQRAACGHVHFSAIALMQDRAGLASSLIGIGAEASALYREPAAAPRFTWLESSSAGPQAPRFSMARIGEQSSLHLRIEQASPAAFRHAFWIREAGQREWQLMLEAAAKTDIVLVPAQAGRIERLVVASLDRQGREGPRQEVRLPA